ncbi:unnamed protein product [Effrenium voratum]|nr:unnamed protein product [Effrenium voratum]CAJ1412276.1 unnamed protein product [Effrenium voratum]
MGKGGRGKGTIQVNKTATLKDKLASWGGELRRGGKGSQGGKGKEKGGSGKGGKSGSWVWVEEEPRKPQWSKGKGAKGGSKGSKGSKGGKAKGKGKRAAPLTSKFWEKKVEEEGRIEQGDTAYPGEIQRYVINRGWGFIRPDNLAGLPAVVKKKLSESESVAVDNGKEVAEKGLLYFRKPDVNHEDGFKLAEGTAVTFRVYTDNLGAGAFDVTQA